MNSTTAGDALGAPSGAPPATPAGGSSTLGRPRSRVQQMLNAYYDLEEISEPDASSEGSPGKADKRETDVQGQHQRGETQDPAVGCKPKEAELEGKQKGIASGVYAQITAGGAFKSALQFLNDMSAVPQSVAAVVSGGPPGSSSSSSGASGSSSTPASLDLNSPSFDMHAFFSAAVERCTLQQLLRLVNELEAEVQVLEQDIHTLVYENYTKFLNATDTVRNARDVMSQVEGQLESLASQVAFIEGSSKKLMDSVHARAAGIEELVAFRQLLEQLQILSSLPQLLRDHLEAGNPETALQLYEHSRLFLAEQKIASPHLQRLLLIKNDADNVCKYAVQLLKQQLDAPEETMKHRLAGIEENRTRRSQVYKNFPTQQPQQQNQPMSAADASRVLRLLLKNGQDPQELLRLFQRGRRHAAFVVLDRCFAKDEPDAAATVPAAAATGEAGEAAASISVASSRPEGKRGRAASADLALEAACRRVSIQYVEVVGEAMKDLLFILKFISVIQADKGSSNTPPKHQEEETEPATLRRVRSAVDAAEKCEFGGLEVEGARSVSSFMCSLIEAAFAPLSALMASTVPAAAAAVRGTSSLATAFARCFDTVLPQQLRQKAVAAAKGAQRKIILQAAALAFKRAYANVTQELLDATAAVIQKQQQQQQQEDGRSGSAAILTADELSAVLAQQHSAAQSIVVEGCVALTDAQQLLQGAAEAAAATPAEADALVRRQIIPWVEGLFELFVRRVVQLTRNTPAAFSGFEEVLRDALGVEAAAPTELQQQQQQHLHQEQQQEELWLKMQVEATLRAALACREGKRPVAEEGQLFPVVLLVYARIGRSLLQIGLPKLEAIGSELFPSLEAGWLGSSSSSSSCTSSNRNACSGASSLHTEQAVSSAAAAPPPPRRLPAVVRLRAAVQSLMTSFVFCRGQEAVQATVTCLAAQYLQQLSSSNKNNDCNSKLPAGTSGCFSPLLKALDSCNQELSLLMNESSQSAAASATSGAPAAAVATAGPHLGSSGSQAVQQQHLQQQHQQHRRLGRPLGRRRSPIEVEMERLFARKQRVFAAVPFSRGKALMALFRIVARAVLEFVRGCCYFNPQQLQQLQVDSAAAAAAVRVYVQTEDASVVDGFFDEIVACAATRCIHNAQQRGGPQGAVLEGTGEGNSILLTESEIEAVLAAERKQKQEEAVPSMPLISATSKATAV